ncbi:MAG: DUF2889 domain-containing protein [Phaeospirillum sp.]|nr:DUF2889 domain-containing protein [Phaeospirillum sp.]
MHQQSYVSRQSIHTRSITIQGYRRDDGLWDMEGTLIDVKGYDLEGLYRKHIQAGEPIHEMRVIVTVDDHFLIYRAEAVTDFAPFPMCGDIAPAFSALAGLCLTSGFMREVRNRFGGRHGCTHIIELLGGIASTAFQTIYPLLRNDRLQADGKPALIDSCHGFAADGEVVASQWPAYSTRGDDGIKSP